MTPKQTRLAMVTAGIGFLALAAILALNALEDNIVFFRSPSELATKPVLTGTVLRVGGLVKSGSLRRAPNDALHVRFIVTDLAHEVSVVYRGILPDLFREGQGVVAEGAFDDKRQFIATSVLAKHDETYMPPEVAAALKASGKANAYDW